MRTAGLGVDVKGLDGASDWHNRPNVETAPDAVGEWQITTLVVSGTEWQGEWALPFHDGSNYRRNILLRSQGGGHQQEVRQLEDWQTYGAFNGGVGLGLRTVVNNVPEGWFQGEIAEVMIYERALSEAEQAQVEGYLGLRHGLVQDKPSDFRYTGHHYHEGSGLHLALYRAYDAELGRWLSEDPIGERGGLNLYGYVGNGPLMFTDPLGLEWYDWPIWNYRIPDPVVNFSAGLGDGLLFNLTALARDGMGIDGVSRCSTAYKAGGWTSFAFGSGRLAYAGLAKAGSKLAASGLQASAFRTGLGNAFRLGARRPYAPNLAKYPTDALLRAAAGRTNPIMNAYGVGVTTTGAYNGLGGPCP